MILEVLSNSRVTDCPSQSRHKLWDQTEQTSRNVKILGWEELSRITTRGESATSWWPGPSTPASYRQSSCQTGGQGIDDSCKTKQQFCFRFSLAAASSPPMFWLTHAKYWEQFGLGELWLMSDEATERRTKKGLAPQDSGRDSVWNSRLGTRFLPGVKSNQNNLLILAQSLNMEHSDTSGRL